MFYGVTQKIRELLQADINVNTVTYGELDEVALNKFTTYPLAHFNVVNVTRGKANTYDIALYLMDVLDQSKENDRDFIRNNNLHDVLNTQEQVGMRLLELLNRGDLRGDGFVLSGSPTFTPFMERFKDDVAGWELTFSVDVPNEMDICGVETFNTFIGGGFINYPTKQDVANAIGIADTEISDFDVVGNDLRFNIASAYTIQINAFAGDRDIQSYLDYDGLCEELATSSFNGAYALRDIKLEGLKEIGNQSLRATGIKRLVLPIATISKQFFARECYLLKYAYIPNMIPVGLDELDNRCFEDARPGLEVVANIANATSNGGNPDGDLQYVTDTLNGTVTYL